MTDIFNACTECAAGLMHADDTVATAADVEAFVACRPGMVAFVGMGADTTMGYDCDVCGAPVDRAAELEFLHA